jgi:hypothetical protein
MKSKNITAIIATIGRDSLFDAIESAKREFENVIVVADSINLDIDSLPKDVLYLKTCQKFEGCNYGEVAWNMGAYASSTKYIAQLGDDDEFTIGAGEFMENKVCSQPDIDIWIPHIMYSDGSLACTHYEITEGSIAAPTYKTQLFYKLPFCSLIKIENDDTHYIDFYHVKNLCSMGAKLEWYKETLYLVRPKKENKWGFGE